MHGIDAGVPAHHALGDGGVGLEEGPGGVAHGDAHRVRHGHELVDDLVQLGVVGLRHHPSSARRAARSVAPYPASLAFPAGAAKTAAGRGATALP